MGVRDGEMLDNWAVHDVGLTTVERTKIRVKVFHVQLLINEYTFITGTLIFLNWNKESPC